jgi:uroporphyrinogen decarboxylase
MTKMTSRQRVWAAVNHQEPDRVPLDIGGGTSTTIVIEGYEKLKKYWGLGGETVVMNKPFRLAKLDEEVLLRLGSDTRPLNIRGPANWKPPATDNPDQFVDLWGITWRKALEGYYWELYKHPLAEATIEDLEKYSARPLIRDSPLGWSKRKICLNTDYAIMADGG